MRIIITEEQLSKVAIRIRQSIEEDGFIETSESTGVSKLKLAKMSGLPIEGGIRDSRFTDDSEIVVSDLLSDLINKDDNYKTCKLEYHMDGVLLWDCRFKDEENYYRVIVDATPYWDADNILRVYITKVVVTPIDSPKDKRSFSVHSHEDEFDCPDLFNDATELMDWFDDEYKPKTYEKIVGMFEDFKLKNI